MAQNIQVTLPDGSKKEVPSGTTPLDIARSISPRLADAALVAKIKPSADNNLRMEKLLPACTRLPPKTAGSLPI
jgi:(p)ppGpp synthase/HD superfamily hydrolase